MGTMRFCLAGWSTCSAGHGANIYRLELGLIKCRNCMTSSYVNDKFKSILCTITRDCTAQLSVLMPAVCNVQTAKLHRVANVSMCFQVVYRDRSLHMCDNLSLTSIIDLHSLGGGLGGVSVSRSTVSRGVSWVCMYTLHLIFRQLGRKNLRRWDLDASMPYAINIYIAYMLYTYI